ncbi:hypothetical protein GF337_00935 [candidate division KSB1 bacterium]|nr:hypothetical protein [candidate division KSB1 bacterium]
MNKKLILLILFLLNHIRTVHSADITIDASAPAKPIRLTSFYGGYHHNRFYFEQTPAFKRAHDLIREISHKRPAIQYWRCQNLLTYRNNPNTDDGSHWFSESRSGHPYDTDRYASTGGYNWTKVNEVFDEIVTRSGLTPVVEFNYMPECMAADPNEIGSYGLAVISPPRDYNEWSSLIRNTTEHFQNRYGVNETRTWYFGVWNEPNYDMFWDHEKYGYDGFIKIYDYSSIPLKEVDNQLQIGGPDNTAVLTYSKSFVQHTYNGNNYCNNQVGSPADYFSVHAYSTSIRFICNEVWKMAADVREIYGSQYKDKKILLTECAPNFQMTKMPYFHNRYTAAWLLGVFDTFLEAADEHGEYYLPKTVHYCGILRDIGRRSLLAYIGEDNNKAEVLKTAPFNVYEMLSYLSEERIPVQGVDFPDGHTDVFNNISTDISQFRCMATRTPGQSIELLIYHFDEGDRLVYNRKDDGDDPAQPYGTYYRSRPVTYNVNVNIDNIPFSSARYRKFVLDKDHSNMFAYHIERNTKSFSTLDQHDDLEMTEDKGVIFSGGQYSETLNMQKNSATLIIIENENVEPGPRLGVAPTSIDFGAYAATNSFTVYNYGDQALTWSSYENPETNWITSLDPASGTIPAGSSQVVFINVDRTGIPDGDYNGQIAITSNGGDQNVDVGIRVGGPELPTIYRINAGGNHYTDMDGNTWDGDRAYAIGEFGYLGGQTSTTNDPIARTDHDPLFNSERYGLQAYQFHVPNGKYQVRLLFADIYFTGPNERLMNVDIEGERKITDLDIYEEVGHDVALIYTFSDIDVSDGLMEITFSGSVRKPKISAIEVMHSKHVDPNMDTSAPSPPLNFRIKN